jgi:hypothetical protein
MSAWRPIPANRLEDIAPRPKAGPRHEKSWHQELADKGCEYISDSCLECPLETCIHDLSPREAFKLRIRLKQGKR